MSATDFIFTSSDQEQPDAVGLEPLARHVDAWVERTPVPSTMARHALRSDSGLPQEWPGLVRVPAPRFHGFRHRRWALPSALLAMARDVDALRADGPWRGFDEVALCVVLNQAGRPPPDILCSHLISDLFHLLCAVLVQAGAGLVAQRVGSPPWPLLGHRPMSPLGDPSGSDGSMTPKALPPPGKRLPRPHEMLIFALSPGGRPHAKVCEQCAQDLCDVARARLRLLRLMVLL